MITPSVAQDSKTTEDSHETSLNTSFSKPTAAADSRRAQLAPQSTLKNKDSAGRFGWLDAVVDSKADDDSDVDVPAPAPRPLVPLRDELDNTNDTSHAGDVVKKKRRPKTAVTEDAPPLHPVQPEVTSSLWCVAIVSVVSWIRHGIVSCGARNHLRTGLVSLQLYNMCDVCFACEACERVGVTCAR